MFLLAAFFKSAAKSAPSEKIKASPSASPSLSVSANSEKIILNKDEKINLTKHYPISKIIVRLGWKVGFDLDASAFLLTSNGKVTRNADFVFYGQRADASGAVTHMGDDKTGDTGEELRVDLERVPQYVSRIVFTVTIYDGEKLDQNFGKVSSAFISVLDEKNSRELLRYDLANKFSTETAVVCGELYRDGTEWDFKAIGNGFSGGLEALCRHYGVNV
ncbi:MAG: TerD family protein [Synergistaceae bacterium]|nr:TerD family protein [Synergistaceae bacterium]